MLMVDLGAGLKGASQAMKERGWEVITLDVDPRFNCDITADVRTWNPLDIYKTAWENKLTAPGVDLLWFSMPCDEFSRESMPWCKTGNVPDMSLIHACLRIRDILRPRYWVCENVRGAIQYFNPLMGKYRFHAGAFYLWGFFPTPGKVNVKWRKKESYGSKQRAERAEIPMSLSRAIAIQIESQATLPLPNTAFTRQGRAAPEFDNFE